MNSDFYTLITGASAGIGKALSIEMASRGHNLILSSLPGEGLDTLCAGLSEKYNIKAFYFEIDLTTKDGPHELFKLTVNNSLKVNILINNAGIGIEGPLEKYSQQEIDNILFLNIRAMTLLTASFIPELRKTSSYILNVSSLGCYVPAAYKSVYLATKSYIYYFTRALASELKGSSIKISMFIPSGVPTNAKVRKRMEGAGMMAKLSSVEADAVARTGIKGMFSGRVAIIPGRINRLIFTLALFIPQGIIMMVTRKIFKRMDAL
jgi:uncharacterized protein